MCTPAKFSFWVRVCLGKLVINVNKLAVLMTKKPHGWLMPSAHTHTHTHGLAKLFTTVARAPRMGIHEKFSFG